MAQWTKVARRFAAEVAVVLRNRKGSISLLAAFSLTAVVGFAGLGTEVGYWYVKQRDMQGAADSAAIAGAAAMLSGEASSTSTTAASTIATQYGFTGGACGASTTTIVCVNNPPSAGTHTADTKAWEVTISQIQPRLFTALFMSSDPQLSARAVATQVAVSAPSCVVALDKTTLQPDLTDNGTANVNMSNCNVFIDSCDTTTGALQVSGNGTYKANATYMCGTAVQSGHSTLTDTDGTFQRTGATYADPYANTSMPSFSGCDHTNMPPVSTTQTLQPGVYCGGLSINGGNVTLAAGTYIINGTSTNSTVGFQINGNATVDGTAGVTIVLTGSGSSASTWAGVQINGTATVNLKAPMPGATQGISPFLFYQDRASPTGTTNQFNGNAGNNFQGALYFPSQKVVWNGNSSVSGTCTQLIVYQVQFNGTNNFNSDSFNCKDLGIVSLNAPGGTSVALVE